jgi:hypothetical protein
VPPKVFDVEKSGEENFDKATVRLFVFRERLGAEHLDQVGKVVARVE